MSDFLSQNEHWTNSRKTVFRFFFLYFFIQAVPLDWKYYRDIFSLNWAQLDFGILFYISRYTSRFFDAQNGFGLNTFADWGIVALLALLGTAIWSFVERKEKNYDALYYWLRVIVRYRLAVAILAYGFIKLFPLQAPYPSISSLNTAYGDFTRWKLFSLSLGIVPGYQSFLGLVEVFAGLLLLYRKTATIGALILLFFTGNVFMSNLAYDGGEGIYAFYLVSLIIFLLMFDLQRLISVFILQKPTEPNRFKLQLFEAWQRYGRIGLKSAFILVFVFVYGIKTYAAYKHGPYQFPETAGLKDAAGVYTVTEFRFNQKNIPFSKTDKQRWNDVVFEKWATLSIRSNQQTSIDSANTEQIFNRDDDKNYEEAGTNGRKYYRYTVDAGKQQLILQAKNSRQPEILTLSYSRPDSSTLVLSGLISKNDSVYAVLQKNDKKYLIKEALKTGRQKGLKL